jgi:ribonucleoside-triphosphate reductase
MSTPSTRAEIITRRTYNRPLNKEGTVFETWAQTVDRVIDHQRWLWTRANGGRVVPYMEDELAQLRQLLLERKASVSGRTLWLGGTDVAKTREASQFNCAFSRAATVPDLVDHFWLLLQGCGVGGMGQPGVLSGLTKKVNQIEVIRSVRTIEEWEKGFRGRETNSESWYTEPDGTRVWYLSVGDSAEAWAKAFGKILAMKRPVDKIVLSFVEIRAPGIRLSGYGWISSGDGPLSKAFTAIVKLLSDRAGQLLSRIDLLDIENWIGTTLSSRRSAEIQLCPFDDVEWEEFALAKKDYWVNGNTQREQSNNSLVFYKKPSKAELYGIFSLMQLAGGSEPGFINGEAALKRAPWFAGVNP